MRRETVDPAAVDPIHRQVAASLDACSADALAGVLATEVRDPACYEASVRVRPGAAARAGRMMIERATPNLLAAVARALAVELPPAAPQWLAAAEREGVPLITGWDRRGGGAAEEPHRRVRR